MTRPFRFGLKLTTAYGRSELQDLARRAEDTGFSTLVVPDHFGGVLAPLPALMSAAAVTTRLRLGTLVLANDFRHPVTLAYEAAAVDLLTDGRLELGLGAGWMREEYEAAGIPFGRPSERVRRLEESVRTIQRLLAGEPLGESDPPRPIQKPIPLLIGGGSPRILRFAGQTADIVSVHHSLRSGKPRADDVDALSAERKLAWIREGAGERFGDLELEVGIGILWATKNAKTVYDSLSRSMCQPAQLLAESITVLVGTESAIIEQIQQRRDRFGFSYYVFMDTDWNVAAPIAAALTGR